MAALRRRLSSPKCCLFKYFGDGGNRSPCHSPFYRHQQVIPGHAAAEGEPDGTSAARSGGWEHNKARFFYSRCSPRGCRAKNTPTAIAFSHICVEEPREVNRSPTTWDLLELTAWKWRKFRTVPAEPSPMLDRLLIPFIVPYLPDCSSLTT